MPDGRITVVTGGASGIGQATAKRFAHSGDFVVIADLQEEAGQDTVKEIEQGAARVRSSISTSPARTRSSPWPTPWNGITDLSAP